MTAPQNTSTSTNTIPTPTWDELLAQGWFQANLTREKEKAYAEGYRAGQSAGYSAGYASGGDNDD
jgi:hypothetical protein